MAINVEAIGEKILALLQGYGYQVQSYSKEGELVWPDTDGIMPEATRFAVAKPNIMVRLSINDNAIVLLTSDDLSEHPVRKQLMQLADNFLLNFDFQVHDKKIKPSGEKFDIAKNAEKDMADVMESDTRELRRMKKLAGLTESTWNEPGAYYERMNSKDAHPMDKEAADYGLKIAKSIVSDIVSDLPDRDPRLILDVATQLMAERLPLDEIGSSDWSIFKAETIEDLGLNPTDYGFTWYKSRNPSKRTGEKNMNEGAMSEASIVIQNIIDGTDDIYMILSRPRDKAEQYVAKIISDMADDVVIERHLHPDDDIDRILEIVRDQLEDQYGPVDENNEETAVSEAPGKKVTDPLAMHVKKIAMSILGTPYSSARIAGGTVYRMSFSLPIMDVRYVSKDSLTPKQKQELKSIKDNLMDAFEAAGIDMSLVDVKFHIAAGVYASVRVKIDETVQAESIVAESSLGRMTGRAKTSHQTLENVKIVVKHKKPVNEESRGARSRNIQSIYLQRGGERFKMAENNLTAARAMARHMTNGGEMYDEVGSQITSLAENYRTLKQFTSYVKNAGLINESNEEYVQLAKESVSTIKSLFHKMSGPKGYAIAVEEMNNYTNTNQILEDDLDVDIESVFTETHFDDRIANAMGQIKGLIGKQKTFQESITKAVESESFSNIRNLLQETDVVGYSSPRDQLAHQVSQMGNAAQNQELSGFLRGVGQKIQGGGGLNQFEYSTIKSCLMSVNEPKLKESKDTDVMESFSKLLGSFILT